MTLLDEDDPAPVEVFAADSENPLLFVCDHAGRAIPRKLGDLGLPPAEFERHIAWDIGARTLSLRLGQIFDASVICQSYSRLVIDCNRRPDARDAVPVWADGAAVRGNQDLTPAELAARIAEIHTPYHETVAQMLDARARRGLNTRLILIHSFTPKLKDQVRPWSFGVLHKSDSALSAAMLNTMRKDGRFAIGDNQPYAMDDIDYTAPRHAIARGLDYCELEMRQDLIADPGGCEAVGALLAGWLTESLDQLEGAL